VRRRPALRIQEVRIPGSTVPNCGPGIGTPFALTAKCKPALQLQEVRLPWSFLLHGHGIGTTFSESLDPSRRGVGLLCEFRKSDSRGLDCLPRPRDRHLLVIFDRFQKGGFIPAL
jgi:hypothetical protein